MAEQVRLSFFERLDLALHRTPRLFLTTIFRFFWELPSRSRLGWPIKRTLVLALIRTRGTILTRRQIQASMPPTAVAVAQFCKSHKLELDTKPVPCGTGCPDAFLHFITLPQTAVSRVDVDAPRVYYYMHGGGYINPIGSFGQLPLSMKQATKAGCKTLVVLEYSLAPGSQYPTQLIQGAQGLSLLLQTYAPNDIVMVGDSAGGNLALGILAHVKQPYPDGRMPSLSQLLVSPLRGALMISPAVNALSTSKSFENNADKDIIWPARMEFFVSAWRPPKDPREIHAEAVLATNDFWKEVPVKHSLLVAGSAEAFFDDILVLTELMGAVPFDGKETGALPSVAVAVEPNGVHVNAAIDDAVGLVGQSMRDMLAWIGRV